MREIPHPVGIDHAFPVKLKLREIDAIPLKKHKWHEAEPNVRYYSLSVGEVVSRGIDPMDCATLTFLLRGGHISVPDRIERGLWPHPPLKLKDVVAHLAAVITRERWFPREWTPHPAGEPVHEGGVIERVSPSRFVYHCRRHHPGAPCVLAEETVTVFHSAKAVAAHYLKWDLGLPGDLDGWKVE